MDDNKNKRPVFLNLFRIRQPVGGVVSITHRVTGVLLVLAMPVAAYLFQQSLQGADGFEHARALLATVPARLAVLVLVWLFAQHLFSGIRHLLMDLDIGIGREAARGSAWAAFAAAAVTVVAVAVAWL